LPTGYTAAERKAPSLTKGIAKENGYSSNASVRRTRQQHDETARAPSQTDDSLCDLSTKLGISQSLVSQHLARMRHEDVVDSRRDAQAVFYSLKEGAASDLITVLYEIFCKDL
jgi:DNA-binding transcriptional ArsR family regulator